MALSLSLAFPIVMCFVTRNRRLTVALTLLVATISTHYEMWLERTLNWWPVTVVTIPIAFGFWALLVCGVAGRIRSFRK